MKKMAERAAIFPVQFLKRFCCRLVEILVTQFYLNISQHMKFFGRAVFIGVISAYNVINPTKG